MTKPVYQCIDVRLNLLYLYKHAVYCTVNVFYFTSTIVHYIFANRHLFNKITLQAINKADLFFSSFLFDLSCIIKFKIQFVTTSVILIALAGIITERDTIPLGQILRIFSYMSETDLLR